MELVIDEPNFELARGVGVARCRVQILREGDRTVVLLTQRIDAGDGRSLGNAAEDFADALRDKYFPGASGRPGFVARHVRNGASEQWLEVADEIPQMMTTFDADGHPHWGGLDADTRRALWGFTQAGRGDVQDPEPVPREWEERWLVYPAEALPDPQRLFRAPCMQSRVRSVANRILQPLRLRVCRCEYHSANWRAAAKLAVAALRAAHLQAPGAEPEQLAWDASDRLGARSHRRGTLEAANALLRDRIVLTSDGLDYVNGQHRSVAMRDQRVGEVPLLMMLAISASAPVPAMELAQSVGIARRLTLGPRHIAGGAPIWSPTEGWGSASHRPAGSPPRAAPLHGHRVQGRPAYVGASAPARRLGHGRQRRAALPRHPRADGRHLAVHRIGRRCSPVHLGSTTSAFAVADY